MKKGKESVLKKQLKSTFGGIPSLKAASVVKGTAPSTETENETEDTPQPEKKLQKGGILSQLKALGKKDSSEALARRLEKLENEIDELDDLMGQLKTLNLLSTDEAQIIQGFRDAVRQAQVMGEKDAQGAYAALDSVKSQARTTRNLMAEKEDLWTKIDSRHKQITIKDGFLHPNIAKDFRVQCAKDLCTEAYDFCMLHLKGKFSTPKGRRNGYTIFLDAASSQQVNTSEKLIKETLHVSTLPLTPQQLNDKAFWTNVSYDALATDLQNNCIGDPWGRLYPYMLDAPQKAVRAAPLSKSAGILKPFLQRIS